MHKYFNRLSMTQNFQWKNVEVNDKAKIKHYLILMTIIHKVFILLIDKGKHKVFHDR